MKLRIRANTLRLRLTRAEVVSIEAGQTVAEETRFPDGSIMRYELVPGARDDAALTTSDGALVLRVEVPAERAKDWAASETAVGLHGEEPHPVGPLTVLIEKDFTCLAPRAGEEELDTFPNPNAA